MSYIMGLRKHVGNAPLMMPAAGIVFYNADFSILLQLREDNHLWAVTGGALEPGESFEEAARREASEELCLDAGAMDLLNIYSGEQMHHVYPNGDEVYIQAAVFLCSDYRGEIKPDPSECVAAQYFSLDNIPDELHPPDRRVIYDAVSALRLLRDKAENQTEIL